MNIVKLNVLPLVINKEFNTVSGMMKTSGLLALLLIINFFSCQSPKKNTGDKNADRKSPVKSGEDKVQHEDWQVHQSDNFNFSLRFPENWEFRAFNADEQFPVLNFYPSGEKEKIEFPITVHARADISFIGIYPKGYGIELPMGDSRKYSNEKGAGVNFRVNSSESKMFLLENGQVWGYFIVPSNPPREWEEHGFIFAQIATDDFEAQCFDKETGEELDMSDCDPMMGDTIKRYGSVNGQEQKLVKGILQALQFNSSQASSGERKGAGASGITVTQPKAGAEITSPLEISGKARGNWYFEAEFTVDLVQDGEPLTTAIVKAQDDWMTHEYVPFSATMNFEDTDAKGEAQLVFRNSNPSGKPELDKTFNVPVEVEMDK